MQIYVHTRKQDELQLVEVEPAMRVDDLLVGHAEGQNAEAWVQEQEQPLERTATLATAGVRERDHLHLSTCRRVEVTVRYGGDAKPREFRPNATIARVFAWATGDKGFDLTPTERAKHTLALCGSDTEPDRASHVGSFADDACGVCLDLVPKERFEG